MHHDKLVIISSGTPSYLRKDKGQLSYDRNFMTLPEREGGEGAEAHGEDDELGGAVGEEL